VRKTYVPALAAALAAVIAGCGSSSKSASSSTQSTTAAAAPAANTSPPKPYGAGAGTSAASTGGSAVVVSTKHNKTGTILAAGPKHLTVYLFEADKGPMSSCSGACAQAWPPVTASSAQASGAAHQAALGTITRPDGTKQVTYNGHPLYYFAKDGDAGDAYGQGVKAFGASWYVLNPAGSKIDTD
jgi:predicted lipoprotein with Yx(FWY)xxD motif